MDNTWDDHCKINTKQVFIHASKKKEIEEKEK